VTYDQMRPKLVQVPDLTAQENQAPYQVWSGDGVFEAIAIGPQSLIDQVYVFSESLKDPVDGILWAQAAAHNDRFRRDQFVRAAHLVSVGRPFYGPIKGPLWVADREYVNRFFTDGDRQQIQDNYLLYSPQIAGTMSMFPAAVTGGFPRGLRVLPLELVLYPKCPPFIGTARPPASACNQVNANEWGGASEQPVCSLITMGRSRVKLSLALDNPGLGTYVVDVYGVDFLAGPDQDLIESSNYTQLLGTMTYTTDNVFETYPFPSDFDAIVVAARNSAGAATAKGSFKLTAFD